MEEMESATRSVTDTCKHTNNVSVCLSQPTTCVRGNSRPLVLPQHNTTTQLGGYSRHAMLATRGDIWEMLLEVHRKTSTFHIRWPQESLLRINRNQFCGTLPVHDTFKLLKEIAVAACWDETWKDWQSAWLTNIHFGLECSFALPRDDRPNNFEHFLR